MTVFALRSSYADSRWSSHADSRRMELRDSAAELGNFICKFLNRLDVFGEGFRLFTVLPILGSVVMVGLHLGVNVT